MAECPFRVLKSEPVLSLSTNMILATHISKPYHHTRLVPGWQTQLPVKYALTSYRFLAAYTGVWLKQKWTSALQCGLM